jgi:hypothetical protein
VLLLAAPGLRMEEMKEREILKNIHPFVVPCPCCPAASRA